MVEDFDGVPALAAFQKKNKKAFESLRKSSKSALKEYWAEQGDDPKKAFTAGLDLLDEGFLNYQCVAVRKQLEEWAGNAKNLGISKRELERWEELGAAYAEAREEGFKEFEKANKKTKL